MMNVSESLFFSTAVVNVQVPLGTNRDARYEIYEEQAEDPKRSKFIQKLLFKFWAMQRI